MNQIQNFPTQSVEAFGKAYFNHLSSVLAAVDLDAVQAMIEVFLEARDEGQKIYFIGNGGSASTASHFANDLGIGTRQSKKPFKAICLADNNSILTAVGNDYGYDQIFSKQISASGNSSNLVNAVKVAKEMQMTNVAITSFGGGAISKIADVIVNIPANMGEYGPAEDGHLILNHMICAFLSRTLGLE